MKTYLGIDWGGTLLKAGLITANGTLLKKETIESESLRHQKVFLDKITQLVRRLGTRSLAGVGIGAPGMVNIPKGEIYYLPNVPGWKGYPLRQKLHRRLGIPVFLDNDANAFALAEAQLGAAKNCRRALFLTLGTGLGGAFILDGRILRSTTSAGEFGHVPISVGGKQCGCGGSGCIETYIGNRHLVARYKRLKKIKRDIDVKEIYQRALRKEKQALRVWEEFSRYLGKFLAGMVNIFNPEVIIFGGGVSGAMRVYKPMVKKVLEHQVMWPNLGGLKLVKAKLRDAGIIGAGLLVKEGNIGELS